MLNVGTVLFGVPGSLDLEFLPVAGPGGTGLLNRALKRDDVALAIMQDARLGMVKCTEATWVIGTPGMIEREGDAHLQQASRDHPGQGAEPVTGNLVFFRPPSGRQT